VNKYKLEKEELIKVLQIDNRQVREQQIDKIKKVKQTRDQSKVDKCLEKLREIARDKSGSGNLLEASIEAARVRCTLGEISQALEDVFTRHVADSRLVSGAYRKTFDDGKNNDELKQVVDRVEVCGFFFFLSFFFNNYLNRNFPKSMVDVLEYL
jgi:methylmalonyl-CoA mutase